MRRLRRGTPGHDLADVAYLHIDYGDGLIASVHANWLSPVKIRHFMVGGSRKSALYNELDPSERLKIYDRGVDPRRTPKSKRKVAGVLPLGRRGRSEARTRRAAAAR